MPSSPRTKGPPGREGFTLFGTPIGGCAVAWGPSCVRGVQLPERTAAATRARIAGRVPQGHEGAPPADIRRLITGILAQFDGEMTDLSGATLDMDGIPPFHRAVYEATRSIPTGATLTYGQVAALAGAPRAARAVGHALARNPFPLVVPCHRVLSAGGIGGFSADGGVITKRRLLALEGVRLPEAPAPATGRTPTPARIP
ncbi:MAG: methylated-DNA--[protein]-cysteine S-methyltransferase [Acidimicrobiales bacterium]